MKLYLLTIYDSGTATVEPFKAEAVTISGKHYHLIAATKPEATKPETTPTKPSIPEPTKPKPPKPKPPKPPSLAKDPDAFALARNTLLDLILDAGDEGFPALGLTQALVEKLPNTNFHVGPLVSALVRTNQIKKIGSGLNARWAIT